MLAVRSTAMLRFDAHGLRPPHGQKGRSIVIACAVWLLALSSAAAGVALGVQKGLDAQQLFATYVPGLLMNSLAYATVGLLITAHLPTNRGGWRL